MSPLLRQLPLLSRHHKMRLLLQSKIGQVRLLAARRLNTFNPRCQSGILANQDERERRQQKCVCDTLRAAQLQKRAVKTKNRSINVLACPWCHLFVG